MRDPERIDYVLIELCKAWRANPDWRLGQLLVNSAWKVDSKRDVFYVEDDEIVKGLQEWRKDGI